MNFRCTQSVIPERWPASLTDAEFDAPYERVIVHDVNVKLTVQPLT